MSNFDFIGSFLGKRAKLQKDGHDMSNLECMSIPFGVNVPVTSVFCVPNEHYKGKFAGVTQTAPMREDNFAQLYSNQKAVFVPMSSICRNYLEITTAARETRKDKLLDFPVYDARVNYLLPMEVAFWQYFLSRICQAFVSVVPNYGQYYFNRGGSADDPFWILNPNDTSLNDMLLPHLNDYDLSDLSLAAHFFDMISADINRTSFAEGTTLSVVIDYVRKLTSSAGTPWYMDFLRISDALGYGNLYAHFDNIFADLFLTINIQPKTIFVLSPNDASGFISMRSTPTGGVGDSIIRKVETNMGTFGNVSLFPLLAYQYYVSMVERSNYRNPLKNVITWDSILELRDRVSINIIYLRGDQLILFDSNFGFNDIKNAFNYLSRTQNNGGQFQLYNQTQRLSTWAYNDYLIYFWSLNNPLLPSDVYTSSQLSVVSGSVPSVSTTELNQNLVKAYADASALYKLRQDLLRAGVRRDKQMQSIFGVSGNQHVTESVRILDDTSNSVDIQGLLNQAETDQAPLGARAARGNGSFGLNFTLDTEDYGFLFITQSFTCGIFYENFMIDRSVALAAKSWWLPQFNHLGLESIRKYHLSFENSPAFKRGESIATTSTDAIGFSARDWHLKQRVNKVHGAFTNFGLASVSPSQRAVFGADLPANLARGNAPFGGFVPTVIDQQSDFYSHEGSMYYNPSMVNNLFVNMVDGALHGDYSFDQFRNAYSLKLHKVSPMPKIGLFKLDV